MIGIQILNRIEKLHNAGYIHRDIKPDNFLIGTGRLKSRIFMIDLDYQKNIQLIIVILSIKQIKISLAHLDIHRYGIIKE